MPIRIYGLVFFLCFSALSTYAEDESDQKFKLTGSARVRAEGANNIDFNKAVSDHTRYVSTRLRVGMLFEPVPEVDVFVQPQFAKVLGTPDTLGTDTSGVTNDTPVGFHQGYITYHPVEMLALTGGRQELSYGDELLIGASGWNNIGRSFDAVKLRTKIEYGWVDLFWSKLRETMTSNLDKDFVGIYSGWDFGIGLDNVDVYVLNRSDRTINPPVTLTAIGTRLKADVAQLMYRVEGTYEILDNSNEYQVDAEVGLTPLQEIKLQLFAEYFLASKAFDQLFPTTHKWLGYADLFSRKNISGFRFGLGLEIISDLKLTGDFHVFRRTDTAISAFNIAGTPWGTTGAEKAIANEVDVVLSYKATKALTLDGGTAYVIPSTYLEANKGADSSVFYFVQGTATF